MILDSGSFRAKIGIKPVGKFLCHFIPTGFATDRVTEAAAFGKFAMGAITTLCENIVYRGS
jgi:hypothetical protein